MHKQIDTTLSVKATIVDIERGLWNLEVTGLESDDTEGVTLEETFIENLLWARFCTRHWYTQWPTQKI